MNDLHKKLIIATPPSGEVGKVILIIRVEDANVDPSDENVHVQRSAKAFSGLTQGWKVIWKRKTC